MAQKRRLCTFWIRNKQNLIKLKIMYYYTFKIKRNENCDDIIMFTSPQVPENVINKSHPNREFIAKMLTEKEFANYSVEQISNSELLVCRSENQIVEL